MRRLASVAVGCLVFACGCAPASPPTPPAPLSLLVRPASPSLPVGVEGVRATSYSGGVAVVGGYTGTSSLSDVWLYHPGKPVQFLARLPVALHDAAVAAVGNRLYVLGGGAFQVYDTMYAIGPNGSVGIVGHLPAPLADATALSWRGKIVLVGGYDGGSVFPATVRMGTSPARLRLVAVLPRGRRYAAAAIQGSDLFLFGGLTPAGPTRSIWRIPLAGGTPVRVGEMPAPYDYGAAFLLGGRLMVAGGELAGRTTRAIWQFTPGRGLHRLGSLPSPVADGAVASLPDGTVLLLGGRQQDGTPVSAAVAIAMK